MQLQAVRDLKNGNEISIILGQILKKSSNICLNLSDFLTVFIFLLCSLSIDICF